MKNTYLRIALRNLNRQKKRSFLLGGAIAFGILIITLVNGLSAGFLKSTNENFSKLAAGHIFLYRQEKTELGKTVSVIRDNREFIGIIDKEKQYIKDILTRSQASGLLIAGPHNYTTQVEGVDWEKESNLEQQLVLKEGNWEEIKKVKNSIIITEAIVRNMNLQLNDSVLFKLETLSGQINTLDFVVKGISVNSGILGSFSSYAGRQIVNEGLAITGDAYTSFSLYLNKYRDIDAVANRLYAQFKAAGLQLAPRYNAQQNSQGDLTAVVEEEWSGVRYQMMTINEITRSLKSISDGLNIAGFVVLGILFIIIMVGLTNSYRMVLYERIREIGTMRALGMQGYGVKRIFYLEAFFLCLFSIAAGMLLAFGFLILISLIDFGINSPLSLFMHNGYIVFVLNLPMILLSVVFVVLVILFAVGFTARKAARLQPAHALRTYF